jgi:hypothetical protein
MLTTKKTKKIKCLNCIRPSFSKIQKSYLILKNKIHGMFYFFSMHFEFNNQFIQGRSQKIKLRGAKISVVLLF